MTISLGILGGTFNPPHRGHVACAIDALEELRLDCVELVPSLIPPHKAIDDPGPEHRLEMCLRAVEGNPRLGVSRVELDRPGPSYTVDTLRELNASDRVEELTFIVGGDMALSLRDWREPEAILELACVAVAPRGPDERSSIVDALRDLQGADRIRYLDMSPVDVSSSMVRRCVAEGQSLERLVPPGVASYIAEHGLYAEASR